VPVRWELDGAAARAVADHDRLDLAIVSWWVGGCGASTWVDGIVGSYLQLVQIILNSNDSVRLRGEYLVVTRSGME